MPSKDFLASLRHATRGLLAACRTQRNLRIHLVMAVAVIAAGGICQVTRIEWLILLLTIGLVIAAEILNTALEAVVDLVSPEIHPLAKRAKDASAACVLVLAITAFGIGLLIFGPHFWVWAHGI